MFGNGRKTIGVIMCDVAAHYQEQLCQTISAYGQDAGYNIAYFTYFSCYGTRTRNGRGELNILYLVPYEKLDAVILCHDTMAKSDALDKTWEYLETRCSCPVVTIRHAGGKYPCVLVNQQHSVENIVYHFVDEHHMSRLGFMSGPYDHPDSIARMEDFRRGLANRGIPFDEKLLFEGDFWNVKAKEAAAYYTANPDEMPEAVICANDYMAIALISELYALGYMVPDDIAVSGFDDIWEASVMMPPVTTVAVPVEAMAEKALRLIEEMWQGHEVPRENYLDSNVAIRNSCGCQTFDMRTMMAKRVRQEKEHNRIQELMQTNTYMMVDLSDMNSLDGIEGTVRLLDYSDNRVRSFYICLGEGQGDTYPKYRSSKPGFAKRSKAIGAVRNRETIKPAAFDTSDLLPAEATEDEPMIFYFFPLHNNQYSFGYFAVTFDGLYSVDRSFANWLAILGNALETIRIKQRNMGLLQELNNLYVHDALTGLYNRRGFDAEAETLYEKAEREQKSFIIIAIDMDNLKVVNDRFGHMNGDLALKTIGAAMESAAGKHDVCARVGGDEYNVVGIDYTREAAEEFIQEFSDYLDDFNDSSNLPYLVHASLGYCLKESGQEMGLEECVNSADGRLYEHKRKKKQEHRDVVLRPDDEG